MWTFPSLPRGQRRMSWTFTEALPAGHRCGTRVQHAGRTGDPRLLLAEPAHAACCVAAATAVRLASPLTGPAGGRSSAALGCLADAGGRPRRWPEAPPRSGRAEPGGPRRAATASGSPPYARRASVPSVARTAAPAVEVDRQADHLHVALRQGLHQPDRGELRGRRQLADVVHRAARHAGRSPAPASQWARVLPRIASAIIGTSSARLRDALRRPWRSADPPPIPGWPSTRAQRAQSRSLPAARQIGRSAVSKTW